MLIDTHCHLDVSDYPNEEELLDKISKSDIKAIIVNGCDVASSIEAVRLAHQYSFIYAAVGFHPENCNFINENDYILFDGWLKDKKVIAIGEIGLDYHYDEDNKEKQLSVFKRQLDIALKYNKPVIIHSRDTGNDTYNILNNYHLKGIIHCFSDNLELANKYIALGYLLGIGGVITFKNSNLKDIIRNVSLNNIVLETDAPYLSPEPYRGTQNSSLNLPIIADAIAKMKFISYEEVAAATTDNATQLFDFTLN